MPPDLDDEMMETLRDIRTREGDDDERHDDDDDVHAVSDSDVDEAVDDQSRPDNTKADGGRKADGAEGEQPRDEKGRFAAKSDGEKDQSGDEARDKGGPLAGEAAPDADLDDEPEEHQQDDPASAASLVNPPSTWRPAAKALWASLPQTIKEEVRKREWDAAKGVKQMRDRVEAADRLDEVIRPYRPLIEAEGGGTTEQVVTNMLNSAYILRQGSLEQKLQMTVNLARQYGFFDPLMAMFTTGRVPNTAAPSSGLTQQQVEQLVEQRLQSEREAAASQSIEREMEEFRTAVNDDGTLKHPYFENVRSLMANILETADTELTLAEAYERAIWADPSTRAVLNNNQQQQERGDAKDRADKARRAADNNVRRKPAPREPRQPDQLGSVDDTLTETMKAIKARQS